MIDAEGTAVDPVREREYSGSGSRRGSAGPGYPRLFGSGFIVAPDGGSHRIQTDGRNAGCPERRDASFRGSVIGAAGEVAGPACRRRHCARFVALDQTNPSYSSERKNERFFDRCRLWENQNRPRRIPPNSSVCRPESATRGQRNSIAAKGEKRKE